MYSPGEYIVLEGEGGEARQGEARRGEGHHVDATRQHAQRLRHCLPAQPNAAAEFTRTIRLAIKLYTRRAPECNASDAPRMDVTGRLSTNGYSRYSG
jgi:hypothetical protein